MSIETTSSSGLLKGKKGLIMGVANDKSIAWGIAQTLAQHGAELAFTYQNDILYKRLQPLAESVGSSFLIQCDVSKEEENINLAKEIQNKWQNLDFVIHAIAFSNKDELKGKYIDTTLDNFLLTMHISCYSFTSIAQHLSPIINNGGSLLTLSYYGAEKVMPHYNVMGVAKSALETSVKYLAEDLGRANIRVNAISAGPIRTLASSAIGDFHYILKWNEYNSPLRRNVSTQEVGGAAVYLVSDLSSGTTGEILHVDAGYNIVGMKAVDAPDIATVM